MSASTAATSSRVRVMPAAWMISPRPSGRALSRRTGCASPAFGAATSAFETNTEKITGSGLTPIRHASALRWHSADQAREVKASKWAMSRDRKGVAGRPVSALSRHWGSVSLRVGWADPRSRRVTRWSVTFLPQQGLPERSCLVRLRPAAAMPPTPSTSSSPSPRPSTPAVCSEPARLRRLGLSRLLVQPRGLTTGHDHRDYPPRLSGGTGLRRLFRHHGSGSAEDRAHRGPDKMRSAGPRLRWRSLSAGVTKGRVSHCAAGTASPPGGGSAGVACPVGVGLRTPRARAGGPSLLPSGECSRSPSRRGNRAPRRRR